MSRLINVSILLILFIYTFINITDISFYDENKTIEVFYNDSSYKLKLGSTINDFINEYSVNPKNIKYDYDFNLPLYDSQIISANNDIEKISINSATLEELMLLKGIGEKTALKIIEYRETNNGFKYLEEIKNINGIGDIKYENIKEYITL